MNTMIHELSATTRRALCFAMAMVIVSAGLTLGAVGADAVYQSALARTTLHVA